MNLVTLILLARLLTGPRGSDGLKAYAAAVHNVTSNPTEQMVLLTVGFRENTFHRGSPTPPFGVTHYASLHPGQHITIDHGARIALSALHFIRQVRCPNASWPVALGRFHHGNGTHAGGCYVDILSRVQAGDLHRLRTRLAQLGDPHHG